MKKFSAGYTLPMLYLAILLVSVVLPVSAEQMAAEQAVFGRLFTSASERHKIDHVRDNPQEFSQVQSAPADASHAPEEQTPATPNIVVNGYIKRNNGENIVWINKQSTLDQDLLKQGIKVDTKNIKKNIIYVSVPGKKLALKPGQMLNSVSGKIEEAYNEEKSESDKEQQLTSSVSNAPN